MIFFRIDETKWTSEDYNKDYLHPALYEYPETYKFIRELERWLNLDFPKVRGFKETSLFEKYYWMQQALRFDKTIIVVRDFRAVINSVLRRNLHQGWWNYEKRLKDFYCYTGSQEEHLVCAEILKIRTNYLIEIIENNPCYVLKLENLLNDPSKELDCLMHYIDLEISEEQMSFFRETSSETRDSTYSNFRLKKDVVDKWKNDLTFNMVKEINNVLEKQLCYFGYEL